jgi:hypothetical protein
MTECVHRDDSSDLGSYSRASDIDLCIVAPTLYKSGDSKMTGVYVLCESSSAFPPDQPTAVIIQGPVGPTNSGRQR